ncbi:MAG: hypothetical protein ACI3VJ_06460 [Hominicoprocola sp.]
MEFIENMLDEILDQLDGVSVTGRENRRRLALAEQKLVAMRGALKEVNRRKKEKEEQAHDEAGNAQQDA